MSLGSQDAATSAVAAEQARFKQGRLRLGQPNRPNAIVSAELYQQFAARHWRVVYRLPATLSSLFTPSKISTGANELYPVFGPDGSLYINSDRGGTGGIYRAARLADGTFAPPVDAGQPFAPRDGDLSFAPDGTFIVLSAQRPRVGGTYKNDLFGSFAGMKLLSTRGARFRVIPLPHDG
jgi:hypothetical protein